MGTLRLLLALAVAIGHGGGLFGYLPLSGSAAVETFFVISGFYISMVIAEKYSTHEKWFRLFWLSRYLRLAPLYVVVSAVTVAASILYKGKWLTLLCEGDWITLSAAFISTVLLAGQDVFVFFGYDLATHTAHFAPDLLTGGLSRIGAWPTPGYSFLAIEPGWSIGVEAWFYLLAPFILRLHWRWVAAVLGLSVAIRAFVVWGLGWGFDPWTHRFFPAELARFLVGYFGYLLIRNVRLTGMARALSWGLWLAVLGFGVGFRYVPLSLHTSYIAFLSLAACSVPVIYNLTKDWRWDRTIGELSYPVYLIHMPLLGACASLGIWKTPVALLLTVVLSVAAYHVIIRPVDRVRGRLVRTWPKSAS